MLEWQQHLVYPHWDQHLEPESPFRPQEKVDFRPALELPPGPGNPRNSEGDFIELKDGRVLYAYSRFNGKTIIL